MTKQYHRTAFCSCGTQFQAKDRWQRSCDKCIEERAAAEAAKPPQACMRCGSTDSVSHRLCPSCRADKKRAYAESRAGVERRKMERFGPCPHHPNHPATYDGVCVVCHQAVVRAARKEALSQQLEEKREAASYAACAARYDQLDDDQKAFFVAMMRALYGDVPDFVKENNAHREDANPEQVAHDDQDRIDAIAASLLDQLEI